MLSSDRGRNVILLVALGRAAAAAVLGGASTSNDFFVGFYKKLLP